jgi:hypothetical protein
MTSPPRVSLAGQLHRRAALDSTHGMQRCVPPADPFPPGPASPPGPAQGAPGGWGCRRPTNRSHLLRRAQDGVDFGEQRDFLGQRPRTVPRPICWAIAVRRRRSGCPRRMRWLDDRQHLPADQALVTCCRMTTENWSSSQRASLITDMVPTSTRRSPSNLPTEICVCSRTFYTTGPAVLARGVRGIFCAGRAPAKPPTAGRPHAGEAPVKPDT